MISVDQLQYHYQMSCVSWLDERVTTPPCMDTGSGYYFLSALNPNKLCQASSPAALFENALEDSLCFVLQLHRYGVCYAGLELRVSRQQLYVVAWQGRGGLLLVAKI